MNPLHITAAVFLAAVVAAAATVPPPQPPAVPTYPGDPNGSPFDASDVSTAIKQVDEDAYIVRVVCRNPDDPLARKPGVIYAASHDEALAFAYANSGLLSVVSLKKLVEKRPGVDEMAAAMLGVPPQLSYDHFIEWCYGAASITA